MVLECFDRLRETLDTKVGIEVRLGQARCSPWETAAQRPQTSRLGLWEGWWPLRSSSTMSTLVTLMC